MQAFRCNFTPMAVRVYNGSRDLGYYYFLEEPWCKKCGSPGVKTEDCILQKKVYGFNRVYPMGSYYSLDHGKDLLSKHIVWLKMGYREYAIPLGKALSLYVNQICPELLEADFVVPVPAHQDKKSEKKDYNHSELLVNEYCKNTNQTMLSCLEQLKPTKFANSNYGIDERYEHVKGMFGMLPSYVDIISGKYILLLDDVVTSCAQSSECSNILMINGAKKVDVITLGRNKLND